MATFMINNCYSASNGCLKAFMIANNNLINFFSPKSLNFLSRNDKSTPILFILCFLANEWPLCNYSFVYEALF